MTLALVTSRALDGIEAPAVQVEVHLANGLPSFTLVGLAETEVKESRERVRAALASSGLGFPHNKRITVNLAPADLPKFRLHPSDTRERRRTKAQPQLLACTESLYEHAGGPSQGPYVAKPSPARATRPRRVF